MAEYSTLAAVDLGSNSFHCQVARVVGDQIYPLDSLREPVRLAAGVGADKLLDAASQERALAFPIEVIAGREEARLIFIGVQHSLTPSKNRRLVIDIGGGSTEFIIGS